LGRFDVLRVKLRPLSHEIIIVKQSECPDEFRQVSQNLPEGRVEGIRLLAA
jgi:hypothetical protein